MAMTPRPTTPTSYIFNSQSPDKTGDQRHHLLGLEPPSRDSRRAWTTTSIYYNQLHGTHLPGPGLHFQTNAYGSRVYVGPNAVCLQYQP